MLAHDPLDDSRDRTPPEGLSAAEAAFMDAHSGTRPNPEALIRARLRSELERQVHPDAALDVEMVADLLGVSPNHVRYRLAERTLYAYPPANAGTAPLIPRWQFIDDKEVPHLGEVLRALPVEFTPEDVKAFIINARVDHPTEDRTVALREWLLTGGDPAVAAALASDQQHTI